MTLPCLDPSFPSVIANQFYKLIQMAYEVVIGIIGPPIALSESSVQWLYIRTHIEPMEDCIGLEL